MKKNNVILIVVAVLLVALLGGAAVLYNNLSDQVDPGTLAPQDPAPEAEPDAPGTVPAPDFIMETADGGTASLSDFLGKPVVLNFWASWCGPCKSEMPAFEQAFQTYGDRVQFVMVNLTDGSQETVASAKAFLDTTGYTFPVYFDTRLEGAVRYGVVGIPVTYFIDAAGNIVAGANSALSADLLTTGLGMILEE